MGEETSIGFHHVFLPWSAVQGLVSIVHLCSKHKNDWPFFMVNASLISVNSADNTPRRCCKCRSPRSRQQLLDLVFRLVTKRTTERGSCRFSVPHAALLLSLDTRGLHLR